MKLPKEIEEMIDGFLGHNDVTHAARDFAVGLAEWLMEPVCGDCGLYHPQNQPTPKGCLTARVVTRAEYLHRSAQREAGEGLPRADLRGRHGAHSGETRHQTAKRYLRGAEATSAESCKEASPAPTAKEET